MKKWGAGVNNASLSATIGSTRVARSAGIRQAAAATTVMTPATQQTCRMERPKGMSVFLIREFWRRKDGRFDRDPERRQRHQCARPQTSVQRPIRVDGRASHVRARRLHGHRPHRGRRAPGGAPPTPVSSSFELSGIAIGARRQAGRERHLGREFPAPRGGNSPGVPRRPDDAGRYHVRSGAQRRWRFQRLDGHGLGRNRR